MTDQPSTHDLVITRVLDAPRELVYRAFTDPDQLAQWFATTGSKMTTMGRERDLTMTRVGSLGMGPSEPSRIMSMGNTCATSRTEMTELVEYGPETCGNSIKFTALFICPRDT